MVAYKTAFNENTILRFRNEIQTLANPELVYTYIRGEVYWLVGSKTVTIVLTDWHTLEKADPERCAEMLQAAEHVIYWQQYLSSKLHC